MKREARLLLAKACDSLILSVEMFNRPNDRGRITATLIHLDHSFEMLLKAAILHRGGHIREKDAKETIGFDACVRRSLSGGTIKCLTPEQAIVVRSINGLRDAAQHHLLDISEAQLYMQVQTGFTVFRDLAMSVFRVDLATHLPNRVLPVSTEPPSDIHMLFDSQMEAIAKLLKPGKRRRVEAEAKIKPLLILDNAVREISGQPSNSDFRRVTNGVIAGKCWNEMFPGVATMEMTTEGAGPSLTLRLSKKHGLPVVAVDPSTDGAVALATRIVNELDVYSLGARSLAKKLGLSTPKTVAVIDYLGIRNRPECYKEFPVDSQRLKRFSQVAIDTIREALREESADEIWAKSRAKRQSL